MANKKITDLELVAAFLKTLSFPVDNAIQTFRATGQQVLDFMISQLILTDTGADSDTTLTSASSRKQVITPTANRTYKLPADCSKGEEWIIVNNAANGSGYNIQLKSSDDDNLVVVYPQTSQRVLALQNNATDASHWRILGTIQPLSMIRVNGGSGYGGSSSGETCIRNFTNVVVTQGSDITRTARTTTTGEFYTINANGVYAMTFHDHHTAGFNIGVSLNSNQLSSDIGGITNAHRLVIQGGNNFIQSCTVVLPLVKGDIVRAHGDGASNQTASYIGFCISQVSKH